MRAAQMRTWGAVSEAVLCGAWLFLASLLWLRVPSQVASGSRKDELVSKKLGVSRGEGRVV